MAKRRTELNPFKSYLFDQDLERQTVYNYVSRVRAILDATSSLDLSSIEESMNQLASTKIPKSSFRTPWRHYVEFMATENIILPMPPSSRDNYRKAIYPPAVAQAAKTLIKQHYYTSKLLAQCRWQHFVRTNSQGKWAMHHPAHPGERWYPPLDLIMTLFQWSSSHQPLPDTPLIAVRPDSPVALASHAISKMIRTI